MLKKLLSSLHRFQFCKFKYYKQLATQINIILPKINEQLGYKSNDQCWVVGFTRKQKEPFGVDNNESVDEKQEKKQEQQKQNQNQSQTNENEENIKFELVLDPLGRQLMDFGLIQKYAQENQLDVFSVDPEKNQVSFKKLREEIYRRYYHQHVFKANSTSKKYKQIRLSEKILENDILTKVLNIKQMIQKGQYLFKIMTENDSYDSEKVLKKFCEMVQQDSNIKTQKYETIRRYKVSPVQKIDRFFVTLDFSSKSKVDYELVDKKWKKYLMKQKIKEEKKDKINQINFDGLEKQSIEVQKSTIHLLRKMKAPLPKGFEEYGEIADKLPILGKKAFIKDMESLKEFEKMKRDLKKKTKPTCKITEIQKQYMKDDTKEQKEKEDQLKEQTQQKIKNDRKQQQQTQQNKDEQEIQNESLSRFIQKTRKKDDKEEIVKKMMKMRTVEDILEQMDQVKGEKVQLSAFETYKMKNLQKQLKKTLDLAGFKQKY